MPKKPHDINRNAAIQPLTRKRMRRDEALISGGTDEEVIAAFLKKSPDEYDHSGEYTDEYCEGMFLGYRSRRQPMTQHRYSNDPVYGGLKGADLEAVQNERWENLCKRVRRADPAAPPSPLSVYMIDHVTSCLIEDARQAQMADEAHRIRAGESLSGPQVRIGNTLRPQNPDWLNVRQEVVASKALDNLLSPSVDLGDGVRDELEKMRIWLGQDDGARATEILETPPETIRLPVLAMTAAAGVRDNPFLWRFLQSAGWRAVALERNPHFGKEGWRGMMDEVIREIEIWSQLNQVSDGPPGEWRGMLSGRMFKEIQRVCDLGRAHGWTLAAEQLGRIEVAAERANEQIDEHEEWFRNKPEQGPGSKGNIMRKWLTHKWESSYATWSAAFALAALPGATAQPNVLALSLRIANTRAQDAGFAMSIWPELTPHYALLKNSSGKSWLRVATDVTRACVMHRHRIGGDTEGEAAWVNVFEQATDMHLKGVTPRDLKALALTAFSSPSLRESLDGLASRDRSVKLARKM